MSTPSTERESIVITHQNYFAAPTAPFIPNQPSRISRIGPHAGMPEDRLAPEEMAALHTKYFPTSSSSASSSAAPVTSSAIVLPSVSTSSAPSQPEAANSASPSSKIDKVGMSFEQARKIIESHFNPSAVK